MPEVQAQFPGKSKSSTQLTSNQTNTMDQSSNTVVGNLPMQSFIQTMQLIPNSLATVSEALTETSDPETENEKENEPDEEMPVDEPTTSNDEAAAVPITDENKSPNTPIKRCQVDHAGIQIAKRVVSNDMKFRSFEIKWDKLSDTTLSKLDKLQEYSLKHPSSSIPRMMRLTKTETCGLVNCIVDQLRIIDTNIHANIMETVAKDMLRKYPCLEIIDDDGYGDGLSYVVFKHKLINHNSYLNRFKQPDRQPVMNTNKTRNVRAGTIKEYWTKTSNECAKEVLAKLRRDEPGLLSDGCLESSQSYIRYRLNEQSDLKALLLELPVLRRRKLLYYHFKQATGIDIDSLRKFFYAKRAKIIEYSSAVRKPGKLLETCSDIDVFQFLASMVGENLEPLILKKEVGTRMEDIHSVAAGPILAAIDMGNARTIYYVYAEQARLSEGTEDFVHAIQDLLSVHYVYNFMYLREASKFLELVQQYLLKILPCKGSKSTASRVGPIQRIVKKVIATLSSYDASLPGPSRIVNVSQASSLK